LCKKILCGLCNAKAERYSKDDWHKYGIKCTFCGEYHLTESARIVLDLLFNVDRAMLAAYVRSEARISANPLLLDDLDIFKNLVKVFSNRRHPFR
jgi:hypothetical protein